MRKNTARHWLHAALDLLPVLLIPVFMIYSHRHTLTEQTTVDIQYKYQSNEVNSVDDLIQGNVYTLHIGQLSIDDFLNTGQWITGYVLNNVNLNPFAEPDESFSLYSLSPTNFIQLYNNENGSPYIYVYYDDYQYEYSDANTTYTFNGLFLNDLILQLYDYDSNVDYTLFSFTDYNEIESVDVQDTNSSVMNVFMDNFNTAVDKYFNMGNVFNMNNVYQWFNTNIFGGNAPVVIYSVWNIVLYEFVMDLLFLLYGLFMWFIDMCRRLMDKPLDSIK